MSSNTNKNETLAADVLRQAGKSENEIHATGKVQVADDKTDQLYDERGRTTGSPVHRAFWSKVGTQHFLPGQSATNLGADETVARSLKVLQANKADGSGYDTNGKISHKTIADLGEN